jgi:hypothetical protein
MRRLYFAIFLTGCIVACGGGGGGGGMGVQPTGGWTQWGSNPQHSGMVSVSGQGLAQQLTDILYDPFVAMEQAESGGGLIAHFQATLVDGNDFYTVIKSGTYIPCSPSGAWTTGQACGPNTWNEEIWSEARYTWVNGQATQMWSYQSDWKPETNGVALVGWEPVFQPVDANQFIYVPGAGGAIWKLNKTDGAVASHITPFGATLDSNTFVASPLSADAQGNVYYNVIQLTNPSLGDPWQFPNDVRGAWLVRVKPDDEVSMVAYAVLVPSAPLAASMNCPGAFFDTSTLPWPPSNSAQPAPQPCGSQRPGVNVAPAIAPDGTIYTVSRAHFDSLVSYLVAVNPDLTPKWAASLQNLLSDGCGVLLPIATNANPNQPNACRSGTTTGVDPTTNAKGSGQVIDQSSSTPTVLPDGSVLYGAITNYAYARGHLMKFDSGGKFLNAYSFGWDSTPAVYAHNGSYSIVIKDNHYDATAYCFGPSPVCAVAPPGPYFITQLSADLNTVEWQFRNTTITADHPNGYEWCVNAPAIDVNGTVYANSEDGNIYAIQQGGASSQSLFLKQSIGAAYTPLSIGAHGEFYAQNDGHLFVVGN